MQNLRRHAIATLSFVNRRGADRTGKPRPTALFLAVATLASPHAGADFTTSFGPSGGFRFDFFDQQAGTRYEFTTGDSLVAKLRASGSVGGITGSRRSVIVPEVTAFGQTIIPEVTADTRTGLKLSTSIDAYAGVVLSAGIETAGAGIGAGFALGPRLTLPDEVRAGEFFSMRGETFVSTSNLDLDVSLPSIDLGMDVVLGGSASGKLEYGLFPITGYQVGNFNFNLPDINLPVFDFNLDLNLPKLPSFGFLDIPDLIPDSDRDDAVYRLKLPGVDPLKPGDQPPPLLSAGEVVLVNPASSATTSAPQVRDGAIVSTTTGDLLRLGLDLDGIASFATTGVSFTGLEATIKPGSVPLATVGYDTLDVKYGIELGYELENSLATYLEVTLDFVDAQGDAVDVLLRDGDVVDITNTYSGRFDLLPEFALLDASDVTLKVDFTGLKREIRQKGSLTLSDYMELRALAARASVLGGIAGLDIGPLLYKKLELAGEFGAFEIYDETITLSDFGLVDGLFDGEILIDAIASQDAYLTSNPSGRFSVLDFKLLSTHEPVYTVHSDLRDLTLVIGTAGPQARTRADIMPTTYTSATTIGSEIGGLYVPRGSELRFARFGGSTARTSTITNDGLIRADVSTDGFTFDQRFASVDPDGLLLVQGSGEMRFGRQGGLTAGTLINGRGHTVSFDQTNAQVITGGSRILAGKHKISNQGLIRARFGGTLDVVTPYFENLPTGTLRAESGSRVNLAGGIDNTGLVEATGADSRIDITSGSIGSSVFDQGRGHFRAADGGAIVVRGALENGTRVLRTRGNLEFLSADGGTTRFETRIDAAGDLRLVTETGGAMQLNGLQRERGSEQIEIVNDGLLELLSGTTSLRPLRPNCPAGQCPPPSPPTIVPVDLTNNGIVRVHGGALFAFDVDIVDYSEGGASLAGGTWELIGQSGIFNNTDTVTELTPGVAAIDVRVNEVFGNAQSFADLAFDEVIDPDTGEVVVRSDIGQLDTRLVYNDADVLLSGSASFDYFDTVEVNRGRLRLAQGQRFHTTANYENRGGETLVDTNASLVVNGALVINGGLVRIGEEFDVDTTTSRLQVAGGEVLQGDGTLVHRDIEVNGGTLRIAERGGLDAVSGSGPDFLGRSAGGGHVLLGGRSWIVRDSVATGADGSETITPGLIDFSDYRAGFDADAVAGVHENRADVLIEGTQAGFLGLETLVRNSGALTLRSGARLERVDMSGAPAALIDGDGFVNEAGGNIGLDGAQFVFAGADSTLVNDGLIELAGNGYLEVGRIARGSGPGGELRVDGVVNAAHGIAARAIELHGGALVSAQIALDGRIGSDASFALAPGGQGGSGGSLAVSGGRIAGAALSLVGGAGGQGGAGSGGNPSGATGGIGGMGGTLHISGGQVVADQGISLRGGTGGTGGTGVERTFGTNGRGGTGGNGGRGGNVILSGGELVVASTIDLRGGDGGDGGQGASFAPDGRSGVRGAAGSLRIQGGTLTASAANFDQAIDGNVLFASGTLRFTDSLFDLGTSSTRLNALVGASNKLLGHGRALAFDDTLAIAAGQSLTLAGGALSARVVDTRGGGSLLFSAGLLDVETFHGDLVQAGGVLAPGNSPGLTTIDGDYTLAAGTLAIELAGHERGTQYDAIDVSGTATLGGLLEVTLLDDFLPGAGDVFQLLAAETISGSFDALSFALLPENLNWQLDYLFDPLGTDFVNLRAAPVPLPPASLLLIGALLPLLRRRRR